MSSSSASEIPPVVLIVGEHITLRDAALAGWRERVLADAPADFNLDRFDLASSGVDAGGIEAAARTLPVMAARRLVHVRGLADRRAARFLDEVLPGYLEAPEPATCLLLEASKVDRRLRWVKRVAEIGQVVECRGPGKPAEVRRWIEQALRDRGRRAARGTAEALLDAVGNDVDLLQREIDKLCLYAGERAEIEPDDVAAVTGQLRPLAVYELTDQIGARRLAPALETTARLLDQGEQPLMMLGALAGHFRRLMRARECRPLEPRVVQERLSLHPFAARKIAEQAGRYDLRRLRRCLEAVRRTDEALKGAEPITPRQAIERLVLAVCS